MGRLSNVTEPGVPGRRRGRLRRARARRRSRRSSTSSRWTTSSSAQRLGAIDTERGAKVSGARFYYLTGVGAQLQLAMLNLAMARRLAAGFVPVVPPVLVKPEAMEGTGFLGPGGRERLPPARGGPLPRRHLGGAARGVPHGRGARRRPAAAALRRLVDLLPQGGRVLRQGHPRHPAGAPVRQDRDVLLRRARGRRGRAPAAARLGEGDARQGRGALPGDRRRGRRPRRLGGAQVRLRGVGADAGPLPRADLDVELHDLPGPPAAGPAARRRRAPGRWPRSTARWPPPGGSSRSWRTTSRPTARCGCRRRCARSSAAARSSSRSRSDRGRRPSADADRASRRAEPTVDELRAGCDRFLHRARRPAAGGGARRGARRARRRHRRPLRRRGSRRPSWRPRSRRCSASPPRCSCPAARWPSRSRCASTPTAPAAAPSLWHPTCHLALHEDQAAERLHGLHPRPVGDPRRLITLADLEEVAEYAAALLLELPQREIGGRLPEWDDLVAQTALARSHGTAHPPRRRPAAGVAAVLRAARGRGRRAVRQRLPLALQGPRRHRGCLLAGDEQLVAEAREWRHRHGGTLFELWPYAAAGLAGLRLRGPRMPAYVEHAKAIAAELATLDGVLLVPGPAGDADDARLPARRGRARWTRRSAGSRSSAACGPGRRPSPTELPGWRVVELSVGDATMEFTPAEVRALVAEILAG